MTYVTPRRSAIGADVPIKEFHVDPNQVIEANYGTETVLTIRDLVKWVLENPDEARKAFGVTETGRK